MNTFLTWLSLNGVSQVFLSGLSAAFLSWLLNGRLLNVYKNKAVIYIGPVVEEASKTGMAVFTGAPVFLTHTVFGMLEAVWEVGSYRRGTAAGMAALATHATYGLITHYLMELYGVFFAMAMAVIIHVIWNYWIMHKTVSRQ
ncbi:MAG: hypothetical protein FH758_14845 [Firmicutes bacterium]|nr:hypothetical protein [Bacillota bacterium]